MDIPQNVGWLLTRLRKNYPGKAEEWCSFVESFGVDCSCLLRAMELLVILYGEQNAAIHAECFLRRDNTPRTLAERELCWVQDGKRDAFFAALRAKRPELFAEVDTLRASVVFAWNSFMVLLLFTQHAEHVALYRGHLPREEELLDSGDNGWNEWNDRLRRRFSPLFQEVCCYA